MTNTGTAGFNLSK